MAHPVPSASAVQSTLRRALLVVIGVALGTVIASYPGNRIGAFAFVALAFGVVPAGGRLIEI
jgi:hypothetical protein